jgi:D-arginine dehydrogenase
VQEFDIIIIGGGIAGLSAGASLSHGARVGVLEAEAALGYHSSGRSATFYHLGIGNETVRALTTFSRAAFEASPEGGQTALSWPKPALWIAPRGMREALDELYAGMRRFSDEVHRLDQADVLNFCPVLRLGPETTETAIIDMTGRKLDADALLQGYVRTLKRNGGQVELDARIDTITRDQGCWRVACGERVFAAPIVVNAAGAWADPIARLAQVAPLGVAPKRRTIIAFDPPAGVETRDWPLVKTAIDEFYMLPEAGQLLASPVDEIPSEPVDAQPEDYDIALAAYLVEQYTTMQVPRIAHRWAGLRSFVADRVPTAGFAGDAPGFFWLAGQGGYGLQTAPAMAAACASLILGEPWPQGLAVLGVTPEAISPTRPALANAAQSAA